MNIDKFNDWLNEAVEENTKKPLEEEKSVSTEECKDVDYDRIQENFSEWLNEGRLSKYWKRRMEARSKRARRENKNKIDREWAELQQEKSRKMNSKIHKIFQNEMEVTDELKEEIEAFLKRVEQKRQDRLKKIKEAELIPLNKKRPKKSLPPLPTNATIGKTSGVVDAYRKKSKKLGGNTTAPGEAFGPGE